MSEGPSEQELQFLDMVSDLQRNIQIAKFCYNQTNLFQYSRKFDEQQISNSSQELRTL
jgi:hypothetical protein